MKPANNPTDNPTCIDKSKFQQEKTAMRSDRKVAVVTGASQGMGAGFVQQA